MEEGDKMSYTKISDKIERVDARTKARGEAMLADYVDKQLHLELQQI